MSTERIRAALGVTSWPPDHYAILGLAAGEVDPLEVELRAAERTERLRAYQLAEPDAATDALNRVAQALVCLTDPAAKDAYDATRGVALKEPLVAPVTPQVLPPVPSPAVFHRHSLDPKREVYRSLAVVRRLRAAWTRLGPLLNDQPARSLDWAASAELLRQLWIIRGHCEQSNGLPVGADNQGGAVIVALARRLRILGTVRAFGERDRARVTADWQAGADRIDQHYRELSHRVRRVRPRTARLVIRWFQRRVLDCILVLLGLAALAVALFRTF
ncbi:MAG: hypothetical protein U0746_12680 [Gemmataceae bacterium]